MDFKNKLSQIIKKNNSLLCVGLDPEAFKIVPRKSFFEFNKWIIEQTHDLVNSYKPNTAFYEAEGIKGLEELKKTIEFLKSNHPDIPVILDAKRGDVPNTAKMYAKSVFEFWQADAVTLFPNLGFDSIQPFLEYKDKFSILLIKTSNPDSGQFQNIKTNNGKYYIAMANKIKAWQEKNFGVLVGSTYPKELAEIRKLFPGRVILSPGFGGQGAGVKESTKAGIDKSGAGIMFNASRSIIYSQDPRAAAQELRNEINLYR